MYFNTILLVSICIISYNTWWTITNIVKYIAIYMEVKGGLFLFVLILTIFFSLSTTFFIKNKYALYCIRDTIYIIKVQIK